MKIPLNKIVFVHEPKVGETKDTICIYQFFETLDLSFVYYAAINTQKKYDVCLYIDNLNC